MRAADVVGNGAVTDCQRAAVENAAAPVIESVNSIVADGDVGERKIAVVGYAAGDIRRLAMLNRDTRHNDDDWRASAGTVAIHHRCRVSGALRYEEDAFAGRITIPINDRVRARSS